MECGTERSVIQEPKEGVLVEGVFLVTNGTMTTNEKSRKEEVVTEVGSLAVSSGRV